VRAAPLLIKPRLLLRPKPWSAMEKLSFREHVSDTSTTHTAGVDEPVVPAHSHQDGAVYACNCAVSNGFL